MRHFSKQLLFLITGLFFIFPTVLPGATIDAKATGKATGKATVIKIIDGDSIVIRRNGKMSTLRLYGIDSPEWQQPYSRKARLYLEKLLLGKDVLLEELYTDKFARSVALVYYRGNSVNELLVEKGLAWVHIYYCHKKICTDWKKIERLARERRLGLWQEKRPVPPWVWKRKKRQ